MSVSKQIDVLVMYYLTSHQALEFILGWLTHNASDVLVHSISFLICLNFNVCNTSILKLVIKVSAWCNGSTPLFSGEIGSIPFALVVRKTTSDVNQKH